MAFIESGAVLVGGAPADNAARQVDPGEPVVIVGPPPRFVSRGGEKLDAALDHFGLDVSDFRALDVGASTGGFTDVLLQRGADFVVALDVGHGHMHEKLRADERVRVVEKTNIRNVAPGDLGEALFDVIVCDVSFISLRTIASVLTGGLTGPGALLVALIKPQFEADRKEVSRGQGVIRDPEVWAKAITDVLAVMADNGAATMGVMVSPIHGTSGNVEFLSAFRLHVEREEAVKALDQVDIGQIVMSPAIQAPSGQNEVDQAQEKESNG